MSVYSIIWAVCIVGFILFWAYNAIKPEKTKPNIFRLRCKKCDAVIDNWIPRLCTECQNNSAQHPTYDDYRQDD